MKKRTLVTVSVVSFILAAICFYGATQYLDSLAQEKLFTPVVKVAQGQEIKPFEPITKDDVILISEETDEILPGAFRSLEEVVGKRSLLPIYEGEQVTAMKLRDDHLLPEQGKARYEFPLSFMMPVTELRKGDMVKIWVRYKSPQELAVMPAPTFFAISNPSAELLFTTRLVTVKDSNGTEIYTLKPHLLANAGQMENPLFHGSEIQKYASGEKMYRDYRAQPSAIPAFVGFNLTDREYQMLNEAMQYGLIQVGHIMVTEEGKQ